MLQNLPPFVSFSLVTSVTSTVAAPISVSTGQVTEQRIHVFSPSDSHREMKYRRESGIVASEILSRTAFGLECELLLKLCLSSFLGNISKG